MTVTSATSAANSAATSGTARPSAAQDRQSAGQALSSDFQTFLRMLTTQMQNQDPLNPMESSDFAVQLATFSGVEQQVRTNELLATMQTALGLSGLDRYASWVGKEALVAAPVAFDGTPVSLVVSPAEGAERAQLVVADASGAVVARQDLPLAGGRMEWVGTDDDGAPLPAGTYSLSVESFAGGVLADTDPVPAYLPVTEIRATETGVAVVVPGGAEVAVGSVAALRDPAGG